MSENKLDQETKVQAPKASLSLLEPTVVENENNRQIIADKLRAVFPRGCNRILLVHPLQVPEYKIDVKIAKKRRYYVYPPYALGVLNHHIKKLGCATHVIDVNQVAFSFIHDHPNPEQITSEILGEFWREYLQKQIRDFKPDMVGLTCTFTMAHEVLLESARLVKQVNPEIGVFAGGVHVTNAPEIILNEGKSIDFVSLFESDVSFPEIVQFINGRGTQETLRQVGTLTEQGPLFLKDRVAPRDEALNIIPDFGDLPLEKYTDLGEIGTFRYWSRKDPRRGSAMLTNRGCRAHCSFCSVRNFNGQGVRGRSIDSVIAEIEHLKSKYGINHITWLDDDLFFDEARAVKLFNEIVKRKLDITWDASNGVIASATVAHPELVHAAVESGCIGMYFGIESGNPQILRQIHKPSGVKHFLKVGKLMQQYPQVFTRGFMIIGFPNETLGQIRDTIALANEMALDWYTVQLLTPLPSTEIYNSMVELGLIEKGSLNTSGTGFTMFSVRESERQRRIENSERANARDFMNLLDGDPSVVPSKEQLNDLWLVVDYLINYQRFLRPNAVVVLPKIKAFLTDVADRMTNDNPLANLFLGVIESKLGNNEASERRIELSRQYVATSQYWQRRFDVLDLMPLLNDVAYRGGSIIETT